MALQTVKPSQLLAVADTWNDLVTNLREAAAAMEKAGMKDAEVNWTMATGPNYEKVIAVTMRACDSIRRQASAYQLAKKIGGNK